MFFAGDDALDLVLLAGAEAAGYFLFLDPTVETAVPVVVALTEAAASFLALTAFAEAIAGPKAWVATYWVALTGGALAGGGLVGAEVAG